MRPAVLFFAPLLLLPLVACDGYLTEPEAPSVAEVQQVLSETASPELSSDHHVVLGDVTQLSSSGNAIFAVTFKAVENGGGAGGSMSLSYYDIRYKAKIACVTVVGNQAWLEADIVYDKDHPYPYRFGWRVLDGGVGGYADMLSGIDGFAYEGMFCDELYDVELRPILTGEIEIR